MSFTGTGPVKDMQALGADRVPVEARHPVSIAGESMVHAPPLGGEQVQGEHARWSFRPE